MSVGLISLWTKPWTWSRRTWISVFVATFLATPFVTRWICLWEIPDVELPFAADAALAAGASPVNDLFLEYHRAAELLARDLPDAIRQKWSKALDCPYSAWDHDLTTWVGERRTLLEDFHRASEMATGVDPSMKFDQFMDYHTDLREFTRFSEISAISLERTGCCEDALACRCAILRNAAQADRPGYLISVLIGSYLRRIACDGISRWASNPSVTRDQLKHARHEITEASAKRFSVLHTLKAEYRFDLDQFRKLNPAEALIWGLGEPLEHQALALKRIAFWSIG